jgi:hypothetical protein
VLLVGELVERLLTKPEGGVQAVYLKTEDIVTGLSLQQCCGSMKLWYWSGSVDPHLWLMDPDPAIFVSDLQDVNKINFFFLSLWLITFWRYIYIIFHRQKVKKKSQNSRNQCFSCYCSWMIEGSRSVSLTHGSYTRILHTARILQIRIRNTNRQSAS